MPARDIYHQAVKNALLKDGWTITDDPLTLKWGTKDTFIDFGAEMLLGAEKGSLKIAVEVKSFTSPSEMYDLERALGQFILYRELLNLLEPDRLIYLAIRQKVWENLFRDGKFDTVLVRERLLRLLVFTEDTEEVYRWTPRRPTAKSSKKS